MGTVVSANSFDNEVSAAWKTKKFTNYYKYGKDAARAVYGIDGKVFSRMFDYKEDGYKVNGKVWVNVSGKDYVDYGSTWGTNQYQSSIKITRDRDWWSLDKAGWSYCHFIKL